MAANCQTVPPAPATDKSRRTRNLPILLASSIAVLQCASFRAKLRTQGSGDDYRLCCSRSANIYLAGPETKAHDIGFDDAPTTTLT
jgi:hypothetical protein